MIGYVRSFLCRIGLHRWSTNRGGIKVCQRRDCRAARTFGIQGAMLRYQWREDLYERYQSFTADEEQEGSQ